MADRIEELRRRVQSDPASIAFAALAEEYRRAGQHEEAIATCKAGLRRHPAYLSAHVTLGRALIEVGQYDEARQELEHVLKMAPENLAAIRGLAEIQHRLGHTEAETPERGQAPVQPAPAARAFQPAASIPLTRAEPVPVSEPVQWEAAPAVPAPEARKPEPPEAEAPRVVEAPEVSEAPRVSEAPVMDAPVLAAPAPAPAVEPEPALDPSLARLEGFLAAILRARGDLEGSGPTSRP